MINYLHLKLFCLLLMMGLCYQVQAQDSGTLSFGSAFTHFEVNELELNAASVYLDYTKNYIGAFAIGFGAGVASRQPEGQSGPLRTFAFGLNGYYELDHDWFDLRVGGGLKARFFNEQWPVSQEEIFDNGTVELGAALVAHYDFKIDKNWRVGSRGEIEFLGKNLRTYSAGVHVGYQF